MKLHHDCTGFPQTCAACTYQKQRDEAIELLRQVVADESESRGYAQGGLSDSTLAKIEKYLEGGDGTTGQAE